MKTYESFNNKEQEELFLELARLDELEIKFNFINTPNKLFYHYDGILYFINEKENKYFSINRNWICFEFKNEFGFDESETLSFMETMIEKYFGLYNYKMTAFSII